MKSESYVGEGRCFYLTAGAVGRLTHGPNRPHVSYATALVVKSQKLLFGSAGHRWVASVN